MRGFKWSTSNSQSGMTLVEVIVAVVIFVLLALGSAYFFLMTQRNALAAREQVRATLMTDMIVSRFQNMRFEDVLGADSAIPEGTLNLLGVTTQTVVNLLYTELPQFSDNPFQCGQWHANYFVECNISPIKGILEDILAQVRANGFTRFRIAVRFAMTDSSDDTTNDTVTDFRFFNPWHSIKNQDHLDPNIQFQSDTTHFMGKMPSGVTRAPDTNLRIMAVQLFNNKGQAMARTGILVSNSKLTGNYVPTSEAPLKIDMQYPNRLYYLYNNGDALGPIPANIDLKKSVRYTSDDEPAPQRFKRYLKFPYSRHGVVALQGGAIENQIWRWRVNLFNVVSKLGAKAEFHMVKTDPPFFSRRIGHTPTPGYTYSIYPVNGSHPLYTLPAGLVGDAAFNGLGAATFYIAKDPGANAGLLTQMAVESVKEYYARAEHNGVYSPWVPFWALTDTTPPQVVKDPMTGKPLTVPPSGPPIQTVRTRSPYVSIRIHDIAKPNPMIWINHLVGSGLDMDTISISTSIDGGATFGEPMKMLTQDTLYGNWMIEDRASTTTVVMIDTTTLLPHVFADNVTYDLRAEFADWVTYGTRFPSHPHIWKFKVETPVADIIPPVVQIISPPIASMVGDSTVIHFKVSDPQSGVNPASLAVNLTPPSGGPTDLVSIAQPGKYYTFSPSSNPDGTAGTGGFEVQIPYPTTSAGVYTVEITLEDWRGNPKTLLGWTFSR